MEERTEWFAKDLSIQPEPLVVSLWKYRLREDRKQVDRGMGNLVSSKTTKGRHMPILDLDFPHRIVESSSEGHHHLYLDVPMSRWRWFVLMCALRYAGVIELGYFVWSLRRGQNFVRKDGAPKVTDAEKTKPTHGWFFRLKDEG